MDRDVINFRTEILTRRRLGPDRRRVPAILTGPYGDVAAA
jgi:hypothetical protein